MACNFSTGIFILYNIFMIKYPKLFGIKVILTLASSKKKTDYANIKPK